MTLKQIFPPSFYDKHDPHCPECCGDLFYLGMSSSISFKKATLPQKESNKLWQCGGCRRVFEEVPEKEPKKG